MRRRNVGEDVTRAEIGAERLSRTVHFQLGQPVRRRHVQRRERLGANDAVRSGRDGPGSGARFDIRIVNAGCRPRGIDIAGCGKARTQGVTLGWTIAHLQRATAGICASHHLRRRAIALHGLLGGLAVAAVRGPDASACGCARRQARVEISLRPFRAGFRRPRRARRPRQRPRDIRRPANAVRRRARRRKALRSASPFLSPMECSGDLPPSSAWWLNWAKSWI